jgi:WD40 repeat protein
MQSSKQPQNYDVVLGGQNPPPIYGAVLGGLAGVQQQLLSASEAERVRAIAQLPQYGQAGLSLLIQALQDSSVRVQKAAYSLLYQHQEPEAKSALRNYDTYPLFECLYSLKGHAGGITAVALSADGQLAVSSSRDATLRVWDLQAREEVMNVVEPSFVYAIALTSDSRTFVIKTREQTLKAWDMRTGQQIDANDLLTRSIASVTVSPNRHRTAKHLISGSQNTIKIWNLKAGREVCILRGHTSLVTAVAIAPKQQILISGSEDRTLRVWGIS